MVCLDELFLRLPGRGQQLLVHIRLSYLADRRIGRLGWLEAVTSWQLGDARHPGAAGERRGLRPGRWIGRFPADGQEQAGRAARGRIEGLTPPGKAPSHPPQQIRQQRRPGIIRYRDSSDCRILLVSHKPS
jgi:hypothetical protein